MSTSEHDNVNDDVNDNANDNVIILLLYDGHNARVHAHNYLILLPGSFDVDVFSAPSPASFSPVHNLLHS